MYSRAIVEQRRRLVEAELRRRHQLPASWELKSSTPAEIAEATAHLASLLDDKGQLRRALTREEELWRVTEYNLCKIDFEYFASRYCKIEDWSGRVVPFRPNRAQRLVLKVMAEMEERGVALMLMFLKARQLGITTLWQALLAHRTFFYRNVVTYTGSAEEKKSKKMVEKLEFIWDSLPWWLRPAQTSARKGEWMNYDEINSSINVQWGNQKGGWARGDTPKVAHLSELASFLNPAELVDAALIRALHEDSFALLGLESTAEGIGNWWHQTWLYNVQADTRGVARLKPVFLPWYIGTDLYPTEAWLRRRPVPTGWQPPEYVTRHAEAAAAYVAASPLLTEALGESWRMPLEQQWFYHLEYEEAKAKKTLHLFLQEMCSTPEEAFQNSNPSVFDVEVVNEVRMGAQARPPLGVYELVGPDVSAAYAIGGHAGQPVDLTCKSASGSWRFGLAPLRLDGWPDHDPQGRVYIWEWPQAGETYGVGVDPSEGVGQDSSVVSVIKRATPEHPDIQVAEFASNAVQAEDLWCWAFALAHLYTTARPGGGWITPRVVIEINIHGGVTCQTEMLKRGWSNFHVQTDFSRTGTQGDGKPRARSDAIGWRTTSATRPKIIGTTRAMIRDGSFLVASPWLASECATLEYNADKARIEASEGNHDDRFFASGLVLTSWYDPQLWGSVPNAWLGQREEEKRRRERPAYVHNVVTGPPERRFGKPAAPKGDSRSLYDFA